MDGIANYFPSENALDFRILHIQSENFSGGNAPDFSRSVRGAWTQTPILAWLASVPIGTVLRNDHWPVCACVKDIIMTSRSGDEQFTLFRECEL